MKLLSKLQHNRQFWFLFVTSVAFFFLRLPSLFEPYWYGDEGIYEVIGFALRHGRFLYTGIWDNKPPMLYLIYALFSGDQVAAKLLSLFAGLLATWTFFVLSKKLFSQFFPSAIATGVFAFLFSIPLIEGNIANAENFMLFPGILAALLIVTALTTRHKQQAVQIKFLAAGILLGLSFLIKVVAVFDLAAFACFAFILSLTSFSITDIFQAVKKVIPLILGFCVPIILCAGFFAATHTFGVFLKSTLFSNVSYVNYANQFIIPQGFLILKTLLLAIAVLVLLIKRKLFSHELLFILLWTVFSMYNSLFSGRPYTHYALVILPSLALLVGLFVAKQKTRLVTGIALIVLLIFLVKSFTFYAHPFTYYTNFAQYMLGQKTTASYQTFFDSNVPRDYAIADFINSRRKPNETIFVWGNSGQIYKLTNTLPPGRFIVAYWIGANLSETEAAFSKHMPTYLITLPGEPAIPFPLTHYRELFSIDNATIYAYTF